METYIEKEHVPFPGDLTGFPGGFQDLLNSRLKYLKNLAIGYSILASIEDKTKNITEHFSEIVSFLMKTRKDKGITISKEKKEILLDVENALRRSLAEEG